MPPTESAFGLELEIDPAITVPGLDGGGGDGGGVEPTAVHLDPNEVERRWAPQAAQARRMRELTAGEETLLSVDLAESAGYLLDAVGVGRVLVSLDGRELLCDPDPAEPDWAFILAAQALPLAATLRGFEVLHASGVVMAGGAVLFAGEPGAGKSSLAAALLRSGAALLGDDAIALSGRDGEPIAYPGTGSLYLRAAEDDRLSDAERARLGPTSTFAGRRRVAVVPAPAAALAALFLLERAERGPQLEPLERVDPFELLAATFNLSVRTPERLVRQLDLVGSLAEGGRIHRLRILPGGDATASAAAVEAYMAAAAQ